MKKIFLLAVASVIGSTAYSQLYVSVSGGYGWEANRKEVGADVSSDGTAVALKGSYGAGPQVQLRGGYFFNSIIGAELAVGYLHGNEVLTNRSSIVNMKAKGRVFGASLSAVVNITENIYARVGGVTKIGGKSVARTEVNVPVPNLGFQAKYQTNFEGKMPFGFIGGVGYKHKLTDRISVFGEVEYVAINVARKKSNLGEFQAADANGNAMTRDEVVARINTLATSDARFGGLRQLIPTLADNQDWSNTPEAPYSSWGIQVGVTYSFW